MSGQMTANVPDGVVVRTLKMHADRRGVLAEIFRKEWRICDTPVQWNAVRSKENVLRGVHVHPTHSDYLAVVDGHMVLGLHDIRKDSPTCGMSALVDLRGGPPPMSSAAEGLLVVVRIAALRALAGLDAKAP